MGVVYKATNPQDGEMVAIKMINAMGAFDLRGRIGLVREASTTAQLRHPNIVPGCFHFRFHPWIGGNCGQEPGGTLHAGTFGCTLSLVRKLKKEIPVIEGTLGPRVVLTCGIFMLIYAWRRRRAGVKPAVSGLLVVALLGFVYGLLRAFHWQRTHTYEVAALCVLLGVLAAQTVSIWITGIKMRRKIRADLGRNATDADLTSIRIWTEVSETEQRNEGNKPLG
jgi:hypothetical protein